MPVLTKKLLTACMEGFKNFGFIVSEKVWGLKILVLASAKKLGLENFGFGVSEKVWGLKFWFWRQRKSWGLKTRVLLFFKDLEGFQNLQGMMEEGISLRCVGY